MRDTAAGAGRIGIILVRVVRRVLEASHIVIVCRVVKTVGNTRVMARIIRIVGVTEVTEVKRQTPRAVAVRGSLDYVTVEQIERIPVIDRAVEACTCLDRLEPLGVADLFIGQIVVVGSCRPEQIRRLVVVVVGVDGSGIGHRTGIAAFAAAFGVGLDRYIVLTVFNSERKGRADRIGGERNLHVLRRLSVPFQLCFCVSVDRNILFTAQYAAPMLTVFFRNHLEVDAGSVLAGKRDRNRTAGTAVDLIRRGGGVRPTVEVTGYKPVADRGIRRERGRHQRHRKGRQNQQNCQNNR